MDYHNLVLPEGWISWVHNNAATFNEVHFQYQTSSWTLRCMVNYGGFYVVQHSSFFNLLSIEFQDILCLAKEIQVILKGETDTVLREDGLL